MGGKALKNCTTRRYERLEYHDLVTEVVDKWEDHFHEFVFPIEAYAEKESFGDMDVLVVSEYLPQDWVEQAVKLFNSKDFYKNGNVLSLEYKDFQIDIIATKLDDIISSSQYFAYNDLGNLVGRIAHNFGLKLGYDGLSYKWRSSDNHVFKEISLLKDWKDILPVLGYDYERYSEGFNTLEDIFEFVVSSSYFYKDIYLLQNRNHTSRVRDAKRKTYMEFLKWIENYEETELQKMNSKFEKSDRLPYLFNDIPDFENQYKSIQKEFEEHEEYKKRFNGDLVKEWTGLEGKELGNFMKWFKEQIDPDRLKKDVLSMNSVLIKYWVTYWFEKWNRENCVCLNTN